MLENDLQQINVVAELDRIGWTYQFVSEDEVKCRCPAHSDESPSCSVNIEKRVWRCHSGACGAKGDFLSFLAHALKTTRRVVLEELSTRYDLTAVKTIDPEVIERYHADVWQHPAFLKELRKRGISDETIRKYRIGVFNNRITIPVSNENGQWVNIRRYLPGAPSDDKMKNTRGRGKVRLYPIDQLKFETIVVCGGEVKALAVAQRLNPLGIGAITATAGEGNWEPEFSRRLRNKRVFVCYDIDEAGRKGADAVCARIKGDAAWVGRVDLPLDPDKYPAGDVNDFFGLEKRSVEDFMKVLDATKMWEPRRLEPELDEEAPVAEMPLAESTKAEYVGRRIRVRGVVSAIDTTPYIVPKTVRADCDRNQPFCSICPVYPLTPKDQDSFVELTISAQSPAILEMVNAGKKTQQDAIRQGLGVPPCKSVSFAPIDHYNVEDVRVTPQLALGSKQSDTVMLPAMCVTHGLESNSSYEFEGRTFPHPRSQQAVLLIYKATPTDDALSQYNPSDDELSVLTLFQPAEWTVEGLHQKLDDLYADLEANVTRIFRRRDLHLLVDLAFHSALVMRFDGREEKAWSDVLIIGDSSQGKTETTKSLMQHYGVGEKVECKNATRAGLLGGLQPLGNRWFVTWGVIPQHDRRLVVLEELKGASTEVIGSLTDMRSSGIAEIPKIERRRTHARTRLIALSNPRGDAPIAAYSYGIEALRELIGGPEDIRRFDAALVVSSVQVDPNELNRLARNRPIVRHKHTSELCRRCVLWAWTRTVDQIEFTEQATDRILHHATVLCSKFTEVVPLVDRGSMRYKLARLSIALAARTFSCGKSAQVLVVRPCHVDYIAATLDRIYSDPTFGYADFSAAYNATRQLRDEDALRKKILATPFPRDIIEQLLYTDSIELRDLCDWTGWDRGEATELLSFLVRKHALTRDGRAYRKNPDFIAMLKSLRDSKDLEFVDRPDYVGEPGSEY